MAAYSVPTITVPTLQAISFFLAPVVGVLVVLAVITAAVSASRRVRETAVPIVHDVIVIIAVVVDVRITMLHTVPCSNARMHMRTIWYPCVQAELVWDDVGLLFWLLAVPGEWVH